LTINLTNPKKTMGQTANLI